MKTAEKVAVVGVCCLALMGAALAVVGPPVLREFRRVSAPLEQVKSRQRALEKLSDETHWKRPERDALVAEQLERFLQVRRRISTARKAHAQELEALPRRHRARSLEELKQVPGIVEGVTGAITAEMDAYVEGKMSPPEYRWIEALVYERWRGALRREGTYPTAVRQAAAEIDGAARQEKDVRVRQRLERLAEELRGRVPPPPEGFDPGIHALLLTRLDDIERWSMDDQRPNVVGPVR